MTRVPVKTLVKLLGKNAAWRVSKTALPPEEREILKAKLPELRGLAAMAEERMNARRKELLQDPEYLRLLEAHKFARDASQQAAGRVHHRPICVGISNNLFFTVKAEGDTWPEVVGKLLGDKVKS